MSLASDVIRRFDKLRSDRGVWDSHWQEIGDRVFPRRADFVTARTSGEKRNRLVFDSTAIHANELLAAGLHGMLTNPATEWFNIKTQDPAANELFEVKEWLSIVQRRMNDAFNDPAAGFSSQMHEDYLEYCAFGTSTMFVLESPSRRGVRFFARPLAESYIAENSDGRIDTHYRQFKWKVRQLVQRWGKEGVSDKVRRLYEGNNWDDDICIIHAIQPRNELERKGKFGRKAMAFAEVYVERDTEHLLEEGGYEELAFFSSRFYKGSMETYGRSPAMTALPDIKMLNEMALTTIKAAQKIVDPPLMAPDDGFLNPVRTIPGGVNYYRAGTPDRIESLQTGGNLPIGLEMMERIQMRIREVFFIDQLQLNVGPQMTATEVMQRTEEKLRLMGPILGRVQSEKLGPMITRVYNILDRQGAFPSAPEALRGRGLKIEYVSPIARAQKQLEAQGIQRTLEIMLPFAQTNPELMDNFNTDRMTQHVGVDLFGIDPTLFNDQRQIAQVREGRMQVQALQAQAAMGEQQARTERDLAQAEATRG